MSVFPSRAALWLLHAIAPAQVVDEFVDDLLEEFAVVAARHGALRARLWLWRQVLSSIPSLVRMRWQGPPAVAGKRDEASMLELRSELRYAVRRMVRSPILSVAVITTVALGTGSASAIVAVARGVWLKPLPFPDAEQIVVPLVVYPAFPRPVSSFSAPDIEDARIATQSLSALSAYANALPTLTGQGDPARVQVMDVTAGMLDVLAVEPQFGRDFRPSDFHAESEPVVILADDFWRTRYAGDPNVVGTAITLDGQTTRVVGVLPAMATKLPVGDWTMLRPLVPPTSGPNSWQSRRGSNWLYAIARVKPGVTIAAAEAELQATFQAIAREHPNDFSAQRSVQLEPLRDHLVGSIRSVLLLLVGAVVAVLAMACANVANLLLTQAGARQNEFAVRTALGGGAHRVARQILVENAVLAAVGGALGILVAQLLIVGLLALYPGTLPRAGEIRIDAVALLATLALTALTALFAAAPSVLRAVRSDVIRDLRDTQRTGGSAAQRRMRWGMVALQVAMTVTVLFAAGLLLRTFVNVRNVDLGFEPSRVVSFGVDLPRVRYASLEQAVAFYDELERELGAIPGVTEVATVNTLPLSGNDWRAPIGVEPQTGGGQADQPTTGMRLVTPGYFKAMGMPLLAGRDVTPADDRNAPITALVNRALAHAVFGDEDVLGKTVFTGERPVQIIGLVGDIPHISLTQPPQPELYMSAYRDIRRERSVVVQVDGDPSVLMPLIRERVRSLDDELALHQLTSLAASVDEQLAPQRFRATLVGTLAGLSLLLAMVGVFSAVAFAVSQRTREIGIRLAVGESPGQVRMRVHRWVLGATVSGSLIGVAGAWYAGGLMQSLVFGVARTDLGGLMIVPALLILVGAAAAELPARRASRLDPLRAIGR